MKCTAEDVVSLEQNFTCFKSRKCGCVRMAQIPRPLADSYEHDSDLCGFRKRRETFTFICESEVLHHGVS